MFIFVHRCRQSLLQDDLVSLQNFTELTNSTVNEPVVVIWILVTTFNILFMQTGFALLEAGIARANSVKTVLLKNLMDFGITVIAWWLFGYAIATLNVDNIAFSLRSGQSQNIWFLSSLAFCSTAVTIVSGGILGRMEVYGYVVFSCYMTIVIYPVLSYWVWDTSGFMYNLKFLDFAGSGVVHTTGAATLVNSLASSSILSIGSLLHAHGELFLILTCVLFYTQADFVHLSGQLSLDRVRTDFALPLMASSPYATSASTRRRCQ